AREDLSLRTRSIASPAADRSHGEARKRPPQREALRLPEFAPASRDPGRASVETNSRWQSNGPGECAAPFPLTRGEPLCAKVRLLPGWIDPSETTPSREGVSRAPLAGSRPPYRFPRRCGGPLHLSFSHRWRVPNTMALGHG